MNVCIQFTKKVWHCDNRGWSQEQMVALSFSLFPLGAQWRQIVHSSSASRAKPIVPATAIIQIFSCSCFIFWGFDFFVTVRCGALVRCTEPLQAWYAFDRPPPEVEEESNGEDASPSILLDLANLDHRRAEARQRNARQKKVEPWKEAALLKKYNDPQLRVLAQINHKNRKNAPEECGGDEESLEDEESEATILCLLLSLKLRHTLCTTLFAQK
eukprot:Skav235162  [mRNA]  locus=scaffold721:15188:21612:+ [translate_table: standard]